jgi:hypothetical protein
MATLAAWMSCSVRVAVNAVLLAAAVVVALGPLRSLFLEVAPVL